MLLGAPWLRCIAGQHWQWEGQPAPPLVATSAALQLFPFLPSCVRPPQPQVHALGYTSVCGRALRFQWMLRAAQSVELPFSWAQLATAWPWLPAEPSTPLPGEMVPKPCDSSTTHTCQGIAPNSTVQGSAGALRGLLELQWAAISQGASSGVSWVAAFATHSSEDDSAPVHVQSLLWGSTAAYTESAQGELLGTVHQSLPIPQLGTAAAAELTGLPALGDVAVHLQAGGITSQSISNSSLAPQALRTWACETSSLQPDQVFAGPASDSQPKRPIVGVTAQTSRQLSIVSTEPLFSLPASLWNASALQQPAMPTASKPLVLSLAASPAGLTLPLQVNTEPLATTCSIQPAQMAAVTSAVDSIRFSLAADAAPLSEAVVGTATCAIEYTAGIRHVVAIDVSAVASVVPVFADVLVRVPGQDAAWSSSWPQDNPAWWSAASAGGGEVDETYAAIASAARMPRQAPSVVPAGASVADVFAPSDSAAASSSSTSFRRALSPGLQIAIVADHTERTSADGRAGALLQATAFAPGLRAWLGEVALPVTAVSADGRIALLQIPDSATLCTVSECADNTAMRLVLANPPVVLLSWVQAARAAAGTAAGTAWHHEEGALFQASQAQWGDSSAPWGIDVSDQVTGGALVCPGACPGSHPQGGEQLAFRLTQGCVGYPVPGPVCYEAGAREQCAFGAGLDCAPCGEGAVCPGGFVRLPLAGYWAANPNSRLLAQACAPPATERCLGWSESGGHSVCGEGYLQGSRRCGECAGGYFPVDSGACIACPSSDSAASLLVPLAIFAGSVLAVFLVMFGAVCVVMAIRGGSVWGGLQRSSTFVVWMVSMMQVVVQVGKTAAPGLPPYLADFYNRLNVLQFDSKGVLHPSCYTASPVTSSLVPLLVALGLMAALIGLFAAWRELHAKQPRCRVCSAQPTGLALRGVFSGATLLFAMVCNTALSALNCETDPGVGERFWVPHPSVVCWDGEHTALGVVAILVLLLYVLGYPILTYIWVSRALHAEMMRSDHKAVYAAVQARAARSHGGLVRIGSSGRSGWDSDSDEFEGAGVELVDLQPGGLDGAVPTASNSRAAIAGDVALRTQELQQGGMTREDAQLAAAGVASYASVLSGGSAHGSMDAVRSRTQAARLLANAPTASSASAATPLASILQLQRSKSNKPSPPLQPTSTPRVSSGRSLAASAKSSRYVLTNLVKHQQGAHSSGTPWYSCLCCKGETSAPAGARNTRNQKRRDTMARLASSLEVSANPLQQHATSSAQQAGSAKQQPLSAVHGTTAPTTNKQSSTNGCCISCIGPAMAWHCREVSRKIGAARRKVQFQWQPSRSQQALHALLDASSVLQQNQALIHFTYNDFRVSMFYFRQLDMLLLALLSVLLTFWAAPASSASAAGRACVTVTLLLGLSAALAIYPRFRQDESWKGPVKIYSLLLAAAASILNSVMWTLAREAEAVASSDASTPIDADPADTIDSRQAGASASPTAGALAQIIFAASIGLFVLLFVAFWYVLLSGAAAEDDSKDLSKRAAKAARMHNAAVPREFEVSYDRNGNPLVAKPAELQVQAEESNSPQGLKGIMSGLFTAGRRESRSGSKFRPAPVAVLARRGGPSAAASGRRHRAQRKGEVNRYVT